VDDNVQEDKESNDDSDDEETEADPTVLAVNANISR
jgi:hypothetical protein